MQTCIKLTFSQVWGVYACPLWKITDNGSGQIKNNRGKDCKFRNWKHAKQNLCMFSLLCLSDWLLSTTPPAQCPANEERSSSSGVILSPGFPSNYPNSQTCSWLLHMVPGTECVKRVQPVCVGLCVSEQNSSVCVCVCMYIHICINCVCLFYTVKDCLQCMLMQVYVSVKYAEMYEYFPACVCVCVVYTLYCVLQLFRLGFIWCYLVSQVTPSIYM